jgi:arsenate reductase
MLKVYFKSTCSTCRNALALIKENTDEEYELVEYVRDVPSQKELKELLKMLGLKAEDLVRKKESLYKEKFAGKKISNTEWIKILHENPILIERPIVVRDGKAIIGRPIEKILDILS